MDYGGDETIQFEFWKMDSGGDETIQFEFWKMDSGGDETIQFEFCKLDSGQISEISENCWWLRRPSCELAEIFTGRHWLSEGQPVKFSSRSGDGRRRC